MNKKRILQLTLLSFLMLLLVACKPKVEDKKEAKKVQLPEVVLAYSDEEVVAFNNRINQGENNTYEGLSPHNNPILTAPEKLPSVLFYDSGIDITYPEEGVKGIYLAPSVFSDPERLNYLLDYVETTALNAVVIDFKDDEGVIQTKLETDNPLVNQNSYNNVDIKELLKDLEKRQIYPIARIVTFKDRLVAEAKPEYSFKDSETGEIWQDGNGAKFINPFLPEIWDYNITIAIEAAKLGFKDIQFDYVRFPEGFQTFSDQLDYNIGNYQTYVTDDPEKFGQERVYAINDFLEEANDKLAPYGADVSADIFGYTAIAGDAPDVRGIGQNFEQIAERVDTISSMIYPSHWGLGFFGIPAPDLEPYNLVDQYMYSENLILKNITNAANSRPWLQDFTDWNLAPGTYQEYGPLQVQQQIVALEENGITEFLLWNPSGIFNEGVDYAPESSGNEYYY
ncbi:putative glycoside hydrolase [Facklamia sp. P13069]|uniref:putative glycoside hydrolase n=1 Tax=Facklamia sp. P13069 TaxID=3421954 RepID=UPI003D182078